MAAKAWAGIVEHYRAFLPVTAETPSLSLQEGNTPLVQVSRLDRRLPGLKLYLKLEGLNPTGSFKDRGMAMAASKAAEGGARIFLCASTGNTAASAAAYAARGGFRCLVVLPEGAVALGKLAQAMAHGARVVALQGNFDQALQVVRAVAARHRTVALVNSVNPFRLEGQKTAAFEICDHLGRAPDYLAIPVGNAGNITAYWKGFCEYHRAGVVANRPRLLGFQATGAAPLVHGRPVDRPETVATAIRIGRPANWEGAVRAVQESGGRFEAVTDGEILDAYRLLAREEGIFVEPASAATLAGIIRLARQGFFPEGAIVAGVLTGHGLKDPGTATELGGQPVVLPPSVDALEHEVLKSD